MPKENPKTNHMARQQDKLKGKPEAKLKEKLTGKTQRNTAPSQKTNP